MDVNGDGAADLLYLAPNSEYALRLRYQTGGGFGPEQVFRLKTPHSRLHHLRADADHNPGAPALALIQAKTSDLQWLRLESGKGEADTELELLPWVHAVPVEIPSASYYALGDGDGDGLTDLFAADPKGAQVLYYRRESGGGFVGPTSFPSWSNIRALAAGDSDGDGRAELYVASRSEQAVGSSQLSIKGRLAFPQLLPIEGEPLDISFLSAGGNTARLACLLRSEKKLQLVVLEQSPGQPWKEARRLELEASRTDPLGLLVGS